eukprot:1741507-Amphidinium_carterae.3
MCCAYSGTYGSVVASFQTIDLLLELLARHLHSHCHNIALNYLFLVLNLQPTTPTPNLLTWSINNTVLPVLTSRTSSMMPQNDMYNARLNN